MRFLILISLFSRIAMAQDCQEYLILLTNKTSESVRLCSKPLISCTKEVCLARNPACKKTITPIPGASPLSQACKSCEGKNITGTNMITKNKESLCRFNDGSWALSIDIMKKFK